MTDIVQNNKFDLAQIEQYKIAPGAVKLNIERHYNLVQEIRKYKSQFESVSFDVDAFEALCDRLNAHYKLLMNIHDGNTWIRLNKPTTVPVLSGMNKSELVKYKLFGNVRKEFENKALDILIQNWDNDLFQQYCERFYKDGINGCVWLYTNDNSLPEEFVQILKDVGKFGYNLSLLFVTAPETLYNYDSTDNSLLSYSLLTEINNIIGKINYDITILRIDIQKTVTCEKMQRELDLYPNVKSYLVAHNYDLSCVYADDYSGKYINDMVKIINNIDEGKDWLLNKYTSPYSTDPIMTRIIALPEFEIHSGTSARWTMDNTKEYFKKGVERFAYDCLKYQKFNVHMSEC